MSVPDRKSGVFRRRLWLPSAGLLAAVALAALSVGRVPAGHVGVTGGRLLQPGWHLHPPFRRVIAVPLAGHLDALDIDRVTPEGARLRVRLTLDYRLETSRLGPGIAILGTGGVETLVTRLAEPVVAATPAPDLLAGVGVRDALTRALAAGGIETERLVARAGSPDELAVAAGGAAGTGLPARDPTGLRLLLIGLDGADWKTIDPLVRAGRMPRLARLMAEGVRAPLRSYDPMISPLLWTTMATGVGPDRHGVADFQAVETASGRHVPITSRFRKVKALWNILDDAGATSAFVAWWASYPVEAVRGFQVSNLVAFETMRPRPPGRQAPPGIVWPADYLEVTAPRLGTAAAISWDDLRPMLHVTRAEFETARDEVLAPPPAAAGGENRRAMDRPISLAISVLAGTRNYAAIAADLAARRPDLASVYFEGIDMIGHRFQHCMAPRMPICSEADFARFHDAVTGFYAIQDQLLGEVVDAAGPGTTVVVVSDHGFRSGTARPADILPYTTQQPVEWHDPEGIFLLSGPGARRGARLASRPTLFDVAPTILHLLGLPAGADMPGRVLTEALDPGFVAAHAPRTIPTWEETGGPRRIAGATADAGASEAEAELLAGLRALGYIGGDEAPPSPAAAGAAAAGGTSGPAEQTQVFYHRNLATYFLKRQDYTRAVDQLLLANERHTLAKTWQMLSEAYLGLGRTAEAVRALGAALDESPTADAEPVLWLVQLRLRDPGGAAAARDDAARYAARTAAKPGLDDAITAVLLEAGGDREGALARFRRSFAADPRRILVAQRLYALEAQDRRVALLLPALMKSVAADPRQDEAENLLGVLLAESGREEEAITAFRQAVDLDPDNPRYAANLGGALARLGRWPAAVEAYERAQTLAPSAANALRLGSAYRRIGDPGRALTAFTEARDRGDASAAPILGMALAESEMGRSPEALRVVEDGLALHPGDPALRRLRDELSRSAALPAPSRPPARASEAAVVPGG